MKRLACLFIFLVMPSFAFAQASPYDDLKIALGSQALKDKVQIAILIVVDKVIQEEDTDPGFDPANHDNRLVWARSVMSDPGNSESEAARFFPVLIAANRDIPVSSIINASDEVIQTKVEEIVDLFAYGAG